MGIEILPYQILLHTVILISKTYLRGKFTQGLYELIQIKWIQHTGKNNVFVVVWKYNDGNKENKHTNKCTQTYKSM